MPYCSFDEGAAVFDATPVDNMFITEYMLRAPGDFVKVYLYALMLCSHPQARMSDVSMAKDLDMTEEEVARAFKYWSHCGLVRQIGDNPKAYAILSAKQLAMTRAMNPGEQLYHREFMEEARRILGGRTLTESECRIIFDWVDVLELPEEVVLMLLQTEMKKSGGRVSLKIADHTAKEWAVSGIRTVEDVERIVLLGREREQQLRRVLSRLGQRRSPSEDEKEMYRKWLDDWGFTPEAVQEACRETTKGVPTMAYLDGILLRQHQKGLREAAEMAAAMQTERSDRDFGREILQTLGRTGMSPTPEEMEAVKAWRAAGADSEMILLAAAAAHRRAGGGSMEETGAVLERWRSRGLNTAEDVRRETERVREENRRLREIYEAAGVEKRPGAADRSQLAEWTAQGFSREMILLAADYAKAHPAPLPALSRILDDWRRAGVFTEDAARREHAAHAAGGKPSAQAPEGYQKRSYTAADYRGMEVDLDKEGAEGC